MNVLLLVIFLSGSAAFGTIREVFPEGCIQDTVNAASQGDTIIIHDGAYAATVVLYGKSLTIGSFFLLDYDTSHITATVISPDALHPDTGSCFVYVYQEPLPNRLIGLTLANGTGTYWTYAQNFAGGAIYIQRTDVEIRGCRIQTSSAFVGGGVAVIGNQNLHDAGAFLEDTEISECISTGWGGGVYANWCSLHVQRSEFDSDDCGPSGTGGIDALDSYVEVDSSSFRNCSGYFGAANLSGSGHVANSLFENNHSSLVSHLFLGQGSHVISNNIFRQNGSSTRSVQTCCDPDDHVIFLHNLIEDNVGTVLSGTLILAGTGGEVAYNVFRNNGGAPLGVLYGFQGSTMRVHHNLFEGSFAADTVGCIFRAGPNSQITLDSNIITGNRGETINCWELYPTVIDARNNYWGHPSGPYHPTSNPSGQGDTLLSDSVLFIPWLTEPPDTSMPPDYLSVREPREIPSTWHLLEIYPNPFNLSIRILLAGFTGNDFEITLHNLLGQVVDVIHRGPMTGGEFTYQAPAYLSSGVYFVKASDQKAIQTKKVVLMK